MFTYLVIPNHFILELLVFERELHVVAAPVVVEEGVGYVVLFL